MNCDQARDMLLDRLDGDAGLQPNRDLDLHLGECAACQQWYREQQLAAAALEKLVPIPVPTDFSARVLAHLPKRKPSPHSLRPERRSSILTWLRRGWSGLLSDVGSPVGRRRLAPALVTVAAALLVMFALLVTLRNGEIPVTPGAAAGTLAWPILAGGIMVIVLAALGFLFLRRK